MARERRNARGDAGPGAARAGMQAPLPAGAACPVLCRCSALCICRPPDSLRPRALPFGQAEPGSTIQFGRVLALKAAGKFHVGKPYLEGVSVQADILEDTKGPKLIVYKMKPKKHYRRTNGHRQPLTKFMVTKIGA